MAKRGGFPGGGMPGNMANLMKQAQKMQRLRSAVDRAAQSVKDTSQHIFRYAKLHAPSEETYFTIT